MTPPPDKVAKPATPPPPTVKPAPVPTPTAAVPNSVATKPKPASAGDRHGVDPELRKAATSRSDKARGEGGTALNDTTKAALLQQVRDRGGLTVAVYIGDESGGALTNHNTSNAGASGEFRKQAYEFAHAHSAVGVTGPGAPLRTNMAMEMNAGLAAQLEWITTAAQAVVGGKEPVRVSTLAVFTHGWEQGIKVNVNEKAVDKAHPYSNKLVTSLSSYKTVYPWARAIGGYLTNSPNVALYACFTGGDADANEGAKPFAKFDAVARTKAALGGGVPLAGLVREGIEQALARREIRVKNPELDLDVLDEKSPLYAQASALETQKVAEIRQAGGVHVWAHLNKGHTVANSRLAEFTGDPGAPGNNFGERTSFPHVLASRILMAASEHGPLPAGRNTYRELVDDLGEKIVVRGDAWSHTFLTRRLEEWAKKARKDKGADKEQLKGVEAEYASRKGAIEARHAASGVESAKEAAIREIPFIGMEKAIGILTRPAAPSLADVSTLPVTDDVKAAVLQGLVLLHDDVRCRIEELRAKAPPAPEAAIRLPEPPSLPPSAPGAQATRVP